MPAALPPVAELPSPPPQAASLPDIPVLKKPHVHSPSHKNGDEGIPFVGPRRREAEAAQSSWNSIPHGYAEHEADATALRLLMKELQPEARKRDCDLTEGAFILAAAAKTLHEHPEFNSHMDADGRGMVLKRSCDLGVSLALGHTLIVPVVRDAPKKDLWTLASELGRLPARARDHQIPEEELHGATFTTTFVPGAPARLVLPVIRRPETAALAVTRPAERAVVIGGGIHARWRMGLGLSYDLRCHDPFRAAAFLAALARRLEAPRSLS
jgi:pyruvate dehydrogenase E2 component (dihydrolipoamide acetyltransferase)